MASLFVPLPRTIRLLDAGAGSGALTKSFVEHQLSLPQKPESIHVTAVECDGLVQSRLESTLGECESLAISAGVAFDFELVNSDFIQYASEACSGGLFAAPSARYNAAIANPPYRKIQSGSIERELLRSVGIETSNLYSGFVSLILRLLEQAGQLVAITPRSFCNGPYFKPFRCDLLARSTLKRLHLYDSRTTAFREDKVLQENVVYHVVREQPQRTPVVISTSGRADAKDRHQKTVSYASVVHPSDPHAFIHLSFSTQDDVAKKLMLGLKCSLSDLGIHVSTGRVVDFRAKDFLCAQPESGTVPLIYPCHFESGSIAWPKKVSRKPNAIVNCKETASLLVPSAVYVLTKRFSAKEERRRVVASLFEPGCATGSVVGFENHLNYFHAEGEGLEPRLARGLCAFLNSTVLDLYFRQFNGHTQVNATDLQNMRYPNRNQLIRIGNLCSTCSGSQAENDRIIEDVIRE